MKKCSKKNWCRFMSDAFTEANRKGINPVEVFSIKTGKHRIAAVAFKKTEKDRGVCLNFCPWCGADVSPELFREVKK